MQVFKTHLFLKPVVLLAVPDGNKFLFANENTLVQNAWPASAAKLLGSHSLASIVGEEHKYVSCHSFSCISLQWLQNLGCSLMFQQRKSILHPLEWNLILLIIHRVSTTESISKPILVLSYLLVSLYSGFCIQFQWSTLEPLHCNEPSNSNSSARSSSLGSGSMWIKGCAPTCFWSKWLIYRNCWFQYSAFSSLSSRTSLLGLDHHRLLVSSWLYKLAL